MRATYMYMGIFNMAQHACNLYVYRYVRYGTTCVQSIDNYELRMLDGHNIHNVPYTTYYMQYSISLHEMQHKNGCNMSISMCWWVAPTTHGWGPLQPTRHSHSDGNTGTLVLVSRYNNNATVQSRFIYNLIINN